MFQENEEDGLSMTDRQRRKQTANILLNNKAGDSRILSFKTKAPAADDAHVNSLKVSTYNFTDFKTIFNCLSSLVSNCVIGRQWIFTFV